MKIELGSVKDSHSGGASNRPAEMDISELLSTRLLVQGNSGSGKSHLLRRLLEQSAPHVQQVIIDPEGDFVSLADEYGHVVVDAQRDLKELEVIASRVREHKVSAVLNLESLEVSDQMLAAGTFLNALFDAPREFWYPVLVVVDEAQLFAPTATGEASDEARKTSLGAMTNLMCRGRKRGLCGIIATQRLAKLAKNVAAEASNFLMGRTFLDIDMARAVDLLGMDKKDAEKFRDLGRGHFIALGPSMSRRPLPIIVGGVVTQARGSTPTLAGRSEMSKEEATDLVLAPVEKSAPMLRQFIPKPSTEADTKNLINTVVAKASENQKAELQSKSATPLSSEDRNNLIINTAVAVLADENFATTNDTGLFQEVVTRIRILRLGIELPNNREFKTVLPVARAGIPAEAFHKPEWQHVNAIVATVPEDLRAIYYLIARSAIHQTPCPSDVAFSRICATVSTNRAWSRVKALETSGFIIVKEQTRNFRTITLPDLDLETPSGDAKGADIYYHPLSIEAENIDDEKSEADNLSVVSPSDTADDVQSQVESA